MHQLRTRELEDLPLRFQLASATCENILNPLRVASIRQCNHEVMIAPKNKNRRSVSTMRSPSNMHDDSHPWHIPRQTSENAIRDMQIEARKPPRCGHLV